MASEHIMEPSISSELSLTTTATYQHSHKVSSTDQPPQQDDNQPTTHRKQSRKKSKQRKSQKKQKTPTHLDVIQLEIDKLKQEARRAYEIQARQNATDDPVELTEEEQRILDNRLINPPLIEKLEDLKAKVSSQDTIRQCIEDHGSLPSHPPANLTDHERLVIRFQQETITLLHFFYIVRLAQKGFFNFISQAYPDVNPDALIHLCDKLVGGSLFVVKDPVEEVRSSKKEHVFDLLHKLHNGAPEAVGDGYLTTFEQVQHLIRDFIDSAMPSSQPVPSHHDSTNTHDDKTTSHSSNVLPLPSSSSSSSIAESVKQQPPIWLVVPFNGMIDGMQQSVTAPSAASGHKSKTKKSNDKKKTSRPIIDEQADDTNSVISSATRNTEPTDQPNGSASHKLDQSEKEEVDQTKTTTKDHTESTTTTLAEPVVDAPSVKDTLTDDKPFNNKDHVLEITSIIPQPIDTAPNSATNGKGDEDVNKETIADTTSTKDNYTGKEEEESSGWGTAPTNTTTASSAWTKGLLEEETQPQQRQNITSTGKEEASDLETIPTTTTAAASPAWAKGLVEEEQSKTQQEQTTKDNTTNKEEEGSSGWGDATITTSAAASTWTQGLLKENDQEELDNNGTNKSTIKDENTIEKEEPSGWGTAPTETASPAWTQGLVEQQQPKQQEQAITSAGASNTEDKNTAKEEETSTGWGDAPTTASSSSSSSSSSWKQGLVEQQPSPQQQTDLSQGNGWGSPIVEETNPPAWEGKLPEDLVTPGDETINGDLAGNTWQSVEFEGRRHPSGRGRSSSHRGGGYRPYNDGGRGMRRGGGSNTTGWGNRPNRPGPG